MSPDSCLSIFVSQDSLQDPCLPIHVSASTNMDPLQDPCLRFMSQHLYISGSSARSTSPDSCLSIFISQDPLQDPCLRIHKSASICISGSSARSMSPDPYISIHMYLRILCKIHVSGSMCPIYVLASPNMDPLEDPRLRIHVSASLYLRLLCKIHVSDPYISIHMYLRVLCKIHVSGFMSQHPYVSQEPLQDPCLRIRI